MKDQKTEGITLKAVPYRDSSRIITVLTKDHGIISLMIRNLSRKNSNLLSISSPFCISELVYKKTRGEIYSFIEGNILESNLYLRKDLSYINSAAEMIQAILKSHLQQRKSAGIYLLLKKYIQKVSINPTSITCSFKLKLLNFEGFLKLHPNCNKCEKEATFIESGESLCFDHKAEYSFKFTDEEYKTLLLLTYSKSFSIIEKIDVTKDLKEKIHGLFLELA